MAIVAGDIAFLGVNAADPDQFAMLALKPITGGEVFYVTDGGFTGTVTSAASTTFRSTEGFLEYTAPQGGLAAGAVLLFTAGGGTPASASVALNGGGAAGSVALLANSASATNNFTFSSSGDQLTAYTVAAGTHLTGAPTLLAFVDFGVNPYGAGSAQASSIPTIAGGQVLDLANLDNAIFTAAATAYQQSVATLSNPANFSAQDITRHDLSTLASVPRDIDLSLYRLVARYDLPEPTRTTAPANNLLAQEVSAVTYNWDTDTLFVVGDGGTAIVQVSKTGQLINSMTLATGSSPQGTEFYDTEGLAYVGAGKFVMTEERDRALVQFTYVPDTVLTRADAQTVKLGTTIGNIGFEGVTWDPQTNGFIVAKEITPESVFQTTVDFAAGTASNGSPTATGSTDLFNPALLGLSDIADIFALSNLARLQGQPQSGNLLVLSQEQGRIVNVDRAGNVTSSLTIVTSPGNPLSIADQQHEGLAVGADGTLYVTSENGGGDINHPQLWVYQRSLAPNQAPTGLALNNQVNTLLENSSTASRVKVADLAITDDGIGTNTITLSGGDAGFFEVDANALYIRAGTVLDFETKPSYAVTVNVDDLTVGATPDATASYSLALTDVVNETPAAPIIYISEVAPWSSGNSPVAADWFEVTNGGSVAIDITGWKFDDNSNLFASAVSLVGITSIAAGESVIFLETANLATVGATFLSTWFGANPPAGLRLGSYTGAGVGLGSGGDAVNLFNAAGVLQANVVFGASPTGTFATFNNAAGLNNATVTTLSAVGRNGAAVAVNDAAEIGSPGSVGKLFISEVAPWSSGNSPVAADWFEVTNTTGRAIDITGWKMDDSSGSPVAAVALSGITTIGAGESVIFLETADLAATRTSFINTWFGGTAPAGLQIGGYSGAGVGLGSGGDAVNLYNAANALQASVTFGASPIGPYASFDNAAGLNNATISQLSAAGSNGAFVAAADVNEIASPGGIMANPLLIIGTTGADTLFGGAGAETINGGAGDDVIYGGAGNDTMSGGMGHDIYVVDQAGDVVSESAGAGFDTAFVTGSGWTAGPNIELFYIYGATSFTGSAGAETIVANASGGGTINAGGGHDTIWGGAGGDSLLGGAGDDVIRGGTGNDTMAGGLDNDTYVVDGTGDAVMENADEGFDTVFVTTAGWTAGPNIELFYLYGAASFTGGATAETIVGNASLASTINAGGGNDTIWGGAGAESILGGTGDDVIRGGDGNDTLIGGAGSDQLVGGVGADVFGFDAPGWGYDQIFDFVLGVDKINMAGSGANGFGQLTVQGIAGSTVVMLGADRIDIYGVTLTAGDFLFS